MKRYALAIMIKLLILSNLSFSQYLSVGFKDGISQAGIKYKQDAPSTYHFNNIKWGRNTGLIMNYHISDFLSLQTEVYREEKGFDFDNINHWVDGGETVFGNYKMNYLTIPLLVNLELGKTFKLYGYGGFYKCFILSAHNQITSSRVNLNNPTDDLSYNPENEFRKSELGAIVGLGIKIPLDKKVIFYIDTRYETGLTKAVSGDDIKYTDHQLYVENYYYHVIVTKIHDTYNRSFSVNWGIWYRFTRK